MHGVLIDERIPFDESSFLSPSSCENASFPYHIGVRMPGLKGLKLCSSDFDSDDFLFDSVVSNQNAVDVFDFPAFDFHDLSPSSVETGCREMINVHGNDSFGWKAFATSSSTPAGRSKLVRLGEEMVLDDHQLFGIESLGPGNGGGDSSLGLKSNVNGGLNLSVANAYDNSGLSDAIGALQKFLPSNNEDGGSWPAVDVYSCDEFRMYEFKVRRCMRGKSHDWTECPFAHSGEKARRRDPRRFHYSGIACPDFRKGNCKKGDACEFAHGVFECWLHPARYRTQPCKDGRNCKRKVCFFAHIPEQLRLLPSDSPQTAAASSASRSSFHSSSSKAFLSDSYDGSPLRQALDGALSLNCGGFAHSGLFDGASFDALGGFPRSSYSRPIGELGLGSVGCQISSPTSTLVGHAHSPPSLSPPLSPSESRRMYSVSPGSLSRPSLARSLSGPTRSLRTLSQAQAYVPTCFPNSLSMPASPMSIKHESFPLSSPPSARRKHLDRLRSMPSICTSTFELGDGCHLDSPDLGSVEKKRSSQAASELVSTFQHLELTACAAEGSRMSSSVWSSKPSLFRSSQSLPSTLTKSISVRQNDFSEFDCNAEPRVQMVESGRDLRAKVYSKLCKESLLEEESPDLGWVNELVS